MSGNPNERSMRLLVTGACGVTSRAVVRALGRSERFGHCVLIGTDICDNPFGLYEGLYERIYRVPAVVAAPDRYADLMRQICEREQIDAAVIVPEPEVLFWAEHCLPVKTLLPPPMFSRTAISKERLYDLLRGTDLVPSFEIVERSVLETGVSQRVSMSYPMWARDCGEGSTSGKGALLVDNDAAGRAWAILNPTIERYMISAFMPGRNVACILLFDGGRLLSAACYERLAYFMSRTVMSGVSGNISQGRLINDDEAVSVAVRAVSAVCAHTGEFMSGLVAVDLKGALDGQLKVTEINLRPVAAVSAFAEVPGANIVEHYVALLSGVASESSPAKVVFPEENRIFRDIDGLPVYVSDYRPLEEGAFIDSSKSRKTS